jgi:hypothetical protein
MTTPVAVRKDEPVEPSRDVASDSIVRALLRRFEVPFPAYRTGKGFDIDEQTPKEEIQGGAKRDGHRIPPTMIVQPLASH